MRCKTCDCSLWNCDDARCGECGDGFDLRDYHFTAGTVAFLCPLCGHEHGGQGEKYIPSEHEQVECLGCHEVIDVAKMRVKPLVEGIADAGCDVGGCLPWINRGRDGLFGSWWKTVKLTTFSPGKAGDLVCGGGGFWDGYLFIVSTLIAGTIGFAMMYGILTGMGYDADAILNPEPRQFQLQDNGFGVGGVNDGEIDVDNAVVEDSGFKDVENEDDLAGGDQFSDVVVGRPNNGQFDFSKYHTKMNFVGHMMGRVVAIAIWPFLGALIWAGISHLFLKVTNTAKRPWEDTILAYFYSSGPAAMMLVPFMNVPGLSFIPGIWVIVSFIIILSRVQGVSGGRATIAVLLPFVILFGTLFCCCAAGVAALVGANGGTGGF